jgi:glycolate dehydrogenase FAD-binding subunit
MCTPVGSGSRIYRASNDTKASSFAGDRARGEPVRAAADAPLAPRDAADLVDIVMSHPRALEPVAGGTKRALGRPVDADRLDLGALAGVVSYEPAELVLTARAATPLDEIETTLAANGQRLAFDPPDFARMLGASGQQTLGGVLASNFAGSRRVFAGSARDHFLGFEAVSGRGERFRAGGKVVKNVTGYDLPKLLAGSWGTLAVLTEVTVRVVPAPEVERTLIVGAHTAEHAFDVMRAALGSANEVSSAAFDPERGVLLRLEGFAASVDVRVESLLEDLGGPEATEIDSSGSRASWAEIGGAAALAEWPVVWRLSVPPSEAPGVLARLKADRWLLDWGGGLVWAGYRELDAVRVRSALRGGHAMLFKAAPSVRTDIPVFQPQPAAIAAAAERLRHAFDPRRKLNPGRMG